MRLASLVLAAGRSLRFGSGNKLLADLDGLPVLARTLAAVTAAGFDENLLVIGSDHDAAARIAGPFGVNIVRCPNAAGGMGHSIATGMRAVTDAIDGVAIIPGDMPLITSRSLRSLADAFAAHAGRSIVHAAAQDGAQHNPVIWPRVYFPALLSLQGDRGAKSWIENAIAVRLEDSELLDVDDQPALAAASTVIRLRNTHL